MTERTSKGHRKYLFLKVALSVIVLMAAVSAARIDLALRQVKQHSQISQASPVPLASTSHLMIMPVFESWAKSDAFRSGHGVSYVVETDHTTILLDLGNNEARTLPSPLEHNLAELERDISPADIVVITHNHPDHVGGNASWRKGSFVLPAGVSAPVYTPVDLRHPSHESVLVTESREIAPGVALLGRLPYLNPFPFLLWDPLGWEQSLVVNVEGKGLVVIIGCGHPSLQSIVLAAEAQFGIPVAGVFGGLHYGLASEQELQPDIDFLSLRNPQLVGLSPHDSSGAVLQIYAAAFPEAYRYITIGWPVFFPGAKE